MFLPFPFHLLYIPLPLFIPLPLSSSIPSSFSHPSSSPLPPSPHCLPTCLTLSLPFLVPLSIYCALSSSYTSCPRRGETVSKCCLTEGTSSNPYRTPTSFEWTHSMLCFWEIPTRPPTKSVLKVQHSLHHHPKVYFHSITWISCFLDSVSSSFMVFSPDLVKYNGQRLPENKGFECLKKKMLLFLSFLIDSLAEYRILYLKFCFLRNLKAFSHCI